MNSTDRAVFIAAYSRLVADVWAEPARERLLEADPRRFLAEYGLDVPTDVDIRVVRDGGRSPDLEIQVQAWQDRVRTGTLALFIPPVDDLDETPLSEDELDSVVAGLDTACACCCPCCCT